MTELMITGRDSSFIIMNTSFTKQVHFYICKIQIKPKLYPLSRNRNTVHHYYHIADFASVAPAHTKLNFFPMVSFKQTAELQFKVTADVRQPWTNPHDCYFEYLIIHFDYLIIPFDYLIIG